MTTKSSVGHLTVNLKNPLKSVSLSTVKNVSSWQLIYFVRIFDEKVYMSVVIVVLKFHCVHWVLFQAATKSLSSR